MENIKEYRVISLDNQTDFETGIEILTAQLSEVRRHDFPDTGYSWTPYNGEYFIFLRDSNDARSLVSNPIEIKSINLALFNKGKINIDDKGEQDVYFQIHYLLEKMKFKELKRREMEYGKIKNSLKILGEYNLENGILVTYLPKAKEKLNSSEIDICFMRIQDELKKSNFSYQKDINSGKFEFELILTHIPGECILTTFNHDGLTLESISNALVAEHKRIRLEMENNPSRLRLKEMAKNLKRGDNDII